MATLSFPLKSHSRITHLRVVAVRLKRKYRDEKEEQQLQRGSYPIVQKGRNATEDAPRDDDRIHNGAQAWLSEHNVRCRTRLQGILSVERKIVHLTVYKSMLSFILIVS